MHAEHVLHGLGCDADLLADQRFAAGRAAVQEMQRDVVCVIDVDTRNALGQRRERAPGAQRVEKLITERNDPGLWKRSEEHTSELQSLMRISYAVFCLKKKNKKNKQTKQPEIKTKD